MKYYTEKEIENLVEEWHTTDSDVALYEYLNVSREEYVDWVLGRSKLPKRT